TCSPIATSCWTSRGRASGSAGSPPATTCRSPARPTTGTVRTGRRSRRSRTRRCVSSRRSREASHVRGARGEGDGSELPPVVAPVQAHLLHHLLVQLPVPDLQHLADEAARRAEARRDPRVL